jgi:hypothetical protein
LLALVSHFDSYFSLWFLCGLVSQDLLVAVDKINSSLSKKTNECNFFRQDDIPSFDLGSLIMRSLLSFFLSFPDLTIAK